ncbi:hypothetical protein MMC28_004142 [Mycoblastus sanguinarius]|nr:hypothetical protein [Mycoblastus sanguinarius]
MHPTPALVLAIRPLSYGQRFIAAGLEKVLTRMHDSWTAFADTMFSVPMVALVMQESSQMADFGDLEEK